MTVTSFKPSDIPLVLDSTLRIADRCGQNVPRTWRIRGG
jgi:hypothetical protein